MKARKLLGDLHFLKPEAHFWKIMLELFVRVTELQCRWKVQAKQASYAKAKALAGRKWTLRTGLRAYK